MVRTCLTMTKALVAISSTGEKKVMNGLWKTNASSCIGTMQTSFCLFLVLEYSSPFPLNLFFLPRQDLDYSSQPLQLALITLLSLSKCPRITGEGQGTHQDIHPSFCLVTMSRKYLMGETLLEQMRTPEFWNLFSSPTCQVGFGPASCVGSPTLGRGKVRSGFWIVPFP